MLKELISCKKIKMYILWLKICITFKMLHIYTKQFKLLLFEMAFNERKQRKKIGTLSNVPLFKDFKRSKKNMLIQ